MPELIRAGKIYKALPPLYQLDEKSLVRKTKNKKSKPWLYDKIEYYNLTNTLIADNVEIALENIKGEIIPLNSKAATLKWLNDNAEYDLELASLQAKEPIDSTILQYICYYKVIANGDEEKFKRLFEKQFKEIQYNVQTKALSGSWNSEFFSTICDTIFMKNAERFINVMRYSPSIFVHYKNKNDENDRYTRTTIGSFMNEMKASFMVKIDKHLKGLGESDPDVLFITTMNPKTRKLLQMTMEDAKKAKQTFDIIHGKNTDMIGERRKYLDNLTISLNDIDN